jgi:dipeptidyl-peptidase-4
MVGAIMSRSLIVLLVFTLTTPLLADTPDSTLLTIDRIFASREFADQRAGTFRWIDDGEGYTAFEAAPAPARGRELVRYGTRTGERTVLVPSAWLTPPGSDAPLSVENYTWSQHNERLLIFTNSRRVWRQNTRGDYWVLTLADRTLRKLGGEDAPPSSLMFAEFSPDGSHAAYVRGNDLYVEDLRSDAITRLTSDGSTTIINGTFDWAYEEEFNCRQGFRWSPDGTSLAYWQLDASGVGDFFLINDTDSLYSRPIPIQYPKVGTTISSCRVGTVRATGGPTTWMDVPGDPRNNYIPRLGWTPDSREVVFQRLNRLQNHLQILAGDPATGEIRTILAEQDSAWIDVGEDIQWLTDGKGFTWLSEADGWRHISIRGKDGKHVRLLTPGPFDVGKVVRITGNEVYFTASPDDATRSFLWRVGLTGSPEPERVTPPARGGTHSYDIAPNGKWAFHTFSSIDDPPTTEVISLPGHKTLRVLRDNQRLRQALSLLRPTPVSFFRIRTREGIEMDGWKILPPDFDSTLRYPLIFHVYGEPASQTVLDQWGGSRWLWHKMLAQRGYIFVSIDNRGTPALKGRAWRKSVYRKIGIIASADQADAAREIRQWKYVDTTRIGIWGWSGGGSMTLNMLLRSPELYGTGVSVAPVPDQHLYDAIYQERYMGLPGDNREGYEQGSPITFAANLRGNLLIVHGTGDDNVHWQGTERMINALIAANKQFSMFAYPNRSHGIYEGPNTTRHLYTMITQFFLSRMPPK